VPLIVGEVQNIPGRGMARAVDDPIDAAVPVERLADERFEIPRLLNRTSEPEAPELSSANAPAFPEGDIRATL
jgi:hypothetical protein